MEKLFIIGITGCTGAGKTTVLNVLENLGACVVDCDALYHSMVSEDAELLSALKNEFPEAFESGSFDRKALGRIVFSDEHRLAKLNSITHAAIKRRVGDILAKCEEKIAVIDAIALFESGLDAMCDMTIAVTAPADIRIKRIMERDGVSEDYARLRVEAQKPDEYFKQLCKYEIINDFSCKDDFTAYADTFLRKIITEGSI